MKLAPAEADNRNLFMKISTSTQEKLKIKINCGIIFLILDYLNKNISSTKRGFLKSLSNINNRL